MLRRSLLVVVDRQGFLVPRLHGWAEDAEAEALLRAHAKHETRRGFFLSRTMPQCHNAHYNYNITFECFF